VRGVILLAMALNGHFKKRLFGEIHHLNLS
jgi:hypothetical protein